MSSQKVGTLVGHSSVASSGAFRYELPFWVPRGRKGMTPSLVLQYDSHRGNGLAGVGWMLSPSSAVSRCSKNLSRDDAVDTVNFDNTDNFCLGGEKLVREEDRIGLPKGVDLPSAPFFGEYRTERESFARVLAFGSPEPTSWVVLTRDGQVHHYGETSNAHVSAVRFGTYNNDTLSWLRSRTSDRRDNAIEYEYIADPWGSATRLPHRIRYTVSKSGPYQASSPREIRFHYESRPDPIDKWTNGLQQYMGVRLDSIEILAPNPNNLERVRTYELNYDESTRSKRSLLASIASCDAEDVCLPPTTFGYAQPDVEPLLYDRQSFPLEGPLPFGYNTDLDTIRITPITVLDANGDGFSDVIYLRDLDQIHNGGLVMAPRLRLSTGTPYGAFDSSPTNLNGPFFASSTMYLHAGHRTRTAAPIDYDADGRDDWIAGTRICGDVSLDVGVHARHLPPRRRNNARCGRLAQGVDRRAASPPVSIRDPRFRWRRVDGSSPSVRVRTASALGV